ATALPCEHRASPTRRASDLGIADLGGSLRGGGLFGLFGRRPFVGAFGADQQRAVLIGVGRSALRAGGQAGHPGSLVQQGTRDCRDRKSTRLNSSHVKTSYAV